MIPLIGELYRNHGVVTTVYGHSLVHGWTIDILKAHRFSRQIVQDELSAFTSLPILKAMSQLNLSPARIDIGKLTTMYLRNETGASLETFVRTELADINNGKKTTLAAPQDVVLYGFGRIGRTLGSDSHSKKPAAAG